MRVNYFKNMIIEIAPDYKSISVVLETRPSTGNSNMVLTYIKNCGDPIEVDRTLSPNTSNFTITAADLVSGATTIADGVYNFTMTWVGPVGPLEDDVAADYMEQNCFYVGTTSRCKANKYYESTGDKTVRNIIKALELANQCDDCDCTAMCSLYETLLSKINVTLKTTDYVYNDCGCN